ncbi:hypothetical protein MROS_0563 [Melioribacter roseus P3M-2]|uniref:Uncharacterized protein n=1 Tax=Melioribacter roseus (strain DSM 23840 / JCM 17771 / VKM B-2668 / P3M-2) TaxID=1191523 RepID=I7A1E6_MELRP|nr:DUF6544 family protein [Melioribacter roseus]AFN73806.1 hypothetical protein MROS_0563 [Melioribacter roseus P3M-2]
MRTFALVILSVHGIIHLLGFIKAFDLMKVEELKSYISKRDGILWLLATLLLLSAAVLYSNDFICWWAVCASGIAVSQFLIVKYWRDAKFGTIANLILILPVIITAADSLPIGYKEELKSEVVKRISGEGGQGVVAFADIEHLPAPVQKYLIYTGAVGKPRVYNFRAVAEGEIKTAPDSKFLKYRSTQYNFIDNPARFYYIRSSLYGIPFEGLHTYADSGAVMRIKLASFFTVAEAKGEIMNKSETVTMFNDICLFAPAALIDPKIEWFPVDSLTVDAFFENAGNRIKARLYFNTKGELVNFESDDRYESADGKTYVNYRWSTPVKDYRNFGEAKLASYGEAVWHKPEGKFVYAKMRLKEIVCNTREYVPIKNELFLNF